MRSLAISLARAASEEGLSLEIARTLTELPKHSATQHILTMRPNGLTGHNLSTVRKDERQMVTGFKCLSRSSLVEKSVESSDTLSMDRSPTMRSSSLFNQLWCSRLERVFGTRSALGGGVERDQTLEDREKVTIDTGVQRELILAKDFPLRG